MMDEQTVAQMGIKQQVAKPKKIDVIWVTVFFIFVALIILIAIRRPYMSSSSSITSTTSTIAAPQILPDKLSKINNFPEAWADFNTHVATLRRLQNDPIQKQIQSETDIARGILDRLLPVAQSAGYTWDGNNLAWTATPPVVVPTSPAGDNKSK